MCPRSALRPALPPVAATGLATLLGASPRDVLPPLIPTLPTHLQMAASKAIRSMRRWAYQMTRKRNALRLVVMATPEDIKANAEYVRLADECVHVVGGANKVRQSL